MLLEAPALPCWVCRHFERGRFGHAWKPLPAFMIGAACKEKLSFFPRACRTSFAGPACAAAEEPRPVVNGAAIDLPAGAPDLWEGCRQGAGSLY